MKRKIGYSLLLALLLLSLITTTVLAAGYNATIIVNNSGGALAYEPVKVTQDNSYLATYGYISATGLDVDIALNSVSANRMLTQKQTLFVVPSLDASSSYNYVWSSGNTPDTDTDIVVGKNGYVTVTDTAPLEIGDDFEIETKGYVNTSTPSNLIIEKDGAFYTYISSASEISSAIYAGGVASTETLRPDGAGFATNIPRVVGSVNHWENVDEAVASDADYNYCASDGAPFKDYYTLDATLLNITDRIDSIDVYIRGETTTNVTAENYFRCGLRLGGVDILGTARAPGLVWTTYNETIARPGGGSWSVTDLSTLQVIADVGDDGGAHGGYVSQIYIVVNYTPSLTVTATGITAGVRKVVTTADTVNFVIAVYDSLDVLIDSDSVALGGASVIDTANDWLLFQNDVMPYADYYKHTVGGVEVVWYQPTTILANSTTTYTAGTATFTTGSATVTGAGGAAWTSSMIGGQIKCDADAVYYTITDVPDATTITLNSVYTQTGGAGVAYTLNYYPTCTLLDRDGGDGTQNGTITLGNNTAGVTTSVVNMYPTGVTTVVTTTAQEIDIGDVTSNQGGQITNYSTGTATFTNGSNIVYGTGTTWLSMMAGGQIKLDADGTYYTISGVTSSTQLVLTINYADAGGTGAYTMQYLSGGASSEDILQSNNLLTPWFQPWADLTNIPLITFFLFLGTAILLGAVVLVLKYTQNQFIGVFIMLIGEALLYKIGIYQLWFVIVSAIICLALIVFERKPAF